MFDNQLDFFQQLKGVEKGDSANLEPGFLSHNLLQLVYAEDAGYLTNDTQNLEPFGSLAYVFALHVLCEPLGSNGV